MAGGGVNVQINANASLAEYAVKQFFNDLETNTETATRNLAKALNKKTEIVTKVVFEDDGSGEKVAKVISKEILPEAEKLIAAYKKANSTQEGSITSLRQQVNQAKQVRDSIARLAVDTDIYGKKVQVVNKDWQEANSKVSVLQKALEQAGASTFWDKIKADFNVQGILNLGQGISQAVNIFQSLGIIVQQVTGFVNQFTSALKQVQSIGLTFEAIGAGATGAAKALEESSRISLGLGVDLKTVRDGFQQLSPVILQSGGSLDDVSKITQALSSRFAVFGKSADESKRILNGFIQAFGKGKLMAEELNQQIAEADPAIRVDLANALGVSTAALNDMVQAGELTSEELIRVIPLLDKSALVFGKLGDSAMDAAVALGEDVGVTIAQVEAKIKALNQLTLERFADQFKGLIGTVLGLSASFADFFSALSKTEAVKTLGLALQTVGTAIVTVTNFLLQLVVGLVKLFDPILKGVNAFLQLKGVIEALSVIITIFAAQKLAVFIASTLAAIAAVKAQIAATLGLAAAQGTATASTVALAAATGGIATPLKTITSFLGGLGQKITAAFTAPITPINAMKNAIQGVANNSKLMNAAYSGAGQAALDRYVRTGGQGMSEFGVQVAKAREEINKKKSALAGASSQLKDFAAGAAQMALLSAAVAVVTATVESYFKITKAAADETKRMATITKDADTALKAMGGTVTQASSSFDAAKERVGGFQAFLDKIKVSYQGLPGPIKTVFNLLGSPLQLPTAELASWNTEINATTEGFEAFKLKTDEMQVALNTLGQKSDGSAESQTKLQNAYNSSVAPINANIEAYRKRIAEIEKSNFQDEQARLAAEQLKGTLSGQIAILEEQKQKLADTAVQYGVVTVNANAYTEALRGMATQAKTAADEIKAINQPRIDELKAQMDAEVKAIEDQRQAIKDKYAEEKGLLEERKEALSDAWNAEKERLESSKIAITEKYDKEIEGLQKVLEAENKVYDARIKALQADSPAERRLQEIEIAKLKQEAATAETEEGRLRAQAQLDRIEKEKQIGVIKEEQDANQKRRVEEIKAKEEEKERSLKVLEDERRAAETEHRAKMEAVLDAIAKNVKSQKAEEQKLDKEIAAARAKYLPEIKKLEDDIAKAASNARVAQEKFTTATNETANAAETVRLKLLEQEKILERISKIKPPQPAAPPKAPPPPPKFAGGSVYGGELSTVNELGQEAFLSRSGKLSWINAPAWGEWRAPGAGTVIPAHIAAGLDIPTGGVPINRGAVSSASAPRGRDPIARALMAIAATSGGRTTNNVTIQSDQPVRAASDMLVEMAKIRTRRYR